MNKCLNCDKDVKNKYCNTVCQNSHQGSNNTNKIYGKYMNFEVKCQKCDKLFLVTERQKLFPKKEKYYCSRSCANTRTPSKETKNKIKESLLKIPKKEKEIKTCPYCGKKFTNRLKKQFLCSKKCAVKYRLEKYDYSAFGKIGGSKSRKNNFILKSTSVNDSNIKTFIYLLLDENNMVRYVGKSDNPHKRLLDHIKESKYKRTYKEKWLNSLVEKGCKPTMEIVDEIPFSDWQFWEQYWIEQIRSWGFILVNGTCGGEGSDGFKGKKHSEETKEKLRQNAILYNSKKNLTV